MKIPNWLGWTLEKTVLRNKLTTLEVSLKKSFKDDEQIYESFARQFFSELEEQTELAKAQVEKELGKKL
jgi:uncharacterized protein YeaO (DUF488 family)